MTAPVRTLRRDAERNLGRIIDAAVGLFAEQGYQTSMEEIARRAGVGVGTLYRRFPSKDDLCAAVVEESRRQTRALALQILEEEPPGEGIFTFMRACAEATATWRPLHLPYRDTEQSVADSLARLFPLLQRLVSNARDAGTVRPDVGAGDVAVALLAVRAMADLFDDVAPGTSRRHLALVIGGLRPGGQPMKGQPVPTARLAEVLSGDSRPTGR